MMSFDPDSTALLLIDVVNDFDFEGHEKLLRHALPAAKRIAALKGRLAARGIPAIYVNDNFGQWQRDFADQTERCLAPDAKGREVTETLAPGPGDFFVLKPKHSGFYATSLPVLAIRPLGSLSNHWETSLAWSIESGTDWRNDNRSLLLAPLQ